MNKTVSVILAGAFLTATATVFAADSTNYDTLDQNHDGVISEQEADSSPALKEVWSKVDTNMDGKVDQAEFSAFELAQPSASQDSQ